MVVRRKTFTRRALLRRAGTAALAVSAALVVPRSVHAEPTMPKRTLHPTWDALLSHIDRIAGNGFGPGRLRSWVHSLVLRPYEPEHALLLTGHDRDTGLFPTAMGLLLPERAVVEYPHFPVRREVSQNRPLGHEEWKAMLQDAWLMVATSLPPEPPLCCHKGRYVKWCVTSDGRGDRPIVCAQHYPVEPWDGDPIGRFDLFRRLQDEADAFQRTLRTYV